MNPTRPFNLILVWLATCVLVLCSPHALATFPAQAYLKAGAQNDALFGTSVVLSPSTNGLWLTWVNTNAVERALSVTGPWLVLSNAVSPHLVVHTNLQQFFRLQLPP